MILLLISTAHGVINNSLHLTSSEIIVGLLKVGERTYSQEIGLSKRLYEMFHNWKVKTVVIDCNKIICLKKIQAESLHLAKKDEILANKLTLDRIKDEVAKFIKEQKINRIFIPGNCYNLYPKPFSSTSCQLVTEAVVKIVDDDSTIHLLVICDGLQDIMNAKGIEVVNIANLVSDEEKQRSHLKLVPNPQQEVVSFQQVKIVPSSRLAQIVAKFLPPDENGWFSTYFSDAHSGTVSNTSKNRKKLESLGYRVAAFSIDGVIEALEDKHGNIYFQSHPEALVVKSDGNLCSLNHKARQISMLVAMAVISDFLYRT